MTTQNAIETYDRTLRDCSEDEYPEWVKEVKHCLETGDLIEGTQWMPFVYDVFDELKKRKVEVSMADEKDKPVTI
jgi:hypothetical protein